LPLVSRSRQVQLGEAPGVTDIKLRAPTDVPCTQEMRYGWAASATRPEGRLVARQVAVEGIGGMRIEHNYLITGDGCERLSGHEIRLQ
jgi:Xaa-Pro aminopeptidase